MKLQGIDLDVARMGSGPPLLMLHGIGGPVAAMPFATRLAEKFELIAPVHPGFAGTRIPDRFDCIDDLVYLYLDLLDELDLRDTLLVGFSMGGWVAAEMAAMTTERLARLALVNSVGVKTGGRDDRDIADVFAVSGERLAEILFHDPSMMPGCADLSEEQLETVAADRTALGVYTWEPYMHNPKLPGRLHRVTIPVHFLWGASDGLVSVDYGRGFCAMIPGATMTVIEEAGHAPHLEQPDRFVDALLAFAG